MGKKSGTFISGQHVFAKVKGYSPWPAKITKVIAKHKYGVYFYGTGETATVKSEDLDLYDTKNCVRFNTDRQLKKSDYREAVDQIESARNGNDPAPIITDDKSMKGDFDVTAELTADAITTDNDNSADESQLHIAESPAISPVPKATPNAQKRKAAPGKPILEAAPLEAETKENDEKVSRSGRKIKEKKMNMDEMDPDEMFTPPRKRMKVDEGKQKPISLLAESNNAIDEFRASKLHILLDPVKKGILDNQYEMIHTVQDIKLALGLEQADIDRSIELLESFKTKTLPNITNLMLLKYPNTVDTVKRLRKYVGNLSSWDMEESQVQQFHDKAETIRSTASSIYNKFSALFNFKEDSPFWAQFADEQKKFQEKYVSLSQADLFEGLTLEELDSFVKNNSDDAAEEQTQVPTTPSEEHEPLEGVGAEVEPVKAEPMETAEDEMPVDEIVGDEVTAVPEA